MLTKENEVPQLDERLWRVWRERNEAKDRVSVKRMMIALLIAAALIVLVAAAWGAN